MIELKQHQKEAVQWLNDHNGCGLIYGDPGIGKTFIALEYIKRNCKNILIICPASLCNQWEEETEHFSFNDTIITIINYEKLLNTMIMKELLNHKFDCIILDECQSICNPSAKRTKRVKLLDTTHRIALSGTPCPNALHELWSVMDWIKPGILGKSFWQFKQYACIIHPQWHGIIGYKDEKHIREVIAPYIHRIHKDVLVDLPPKKERYEWVELDETERKMYNELKNTLQLEIEGMPKITVKNVIGMILRLRQLVDCPASVMNNYCRPSSKEFMLYGILMKDKIKTIVFSEFSSIIDKIKYYHPTSSVITGKTPVKQRTKEIEKFNTDPNCHVMFGTAAMANGLNLQIAERVVHLGLPWNNSRLDQRVSRAWRQGQTKEVEEVYILAKDTIDEKMLKLIEKKKNLERSFNKGELLSLLR